MQDWYYIQYGEKVPFQYEYRGTNPEVIIPYPNNFVHPGQIIVAQMVPENNPNKLKSPTVKGPPRKIDFDSTTIFHDTTRNVLMAKVNGYAGFIKGRLHVIPPVVINPDKTEALLYIRSNEVHSIPAIDHIFEIINILKLFPTQDKISLERSIKKAVENNLSFILISKGRSMERAFKPYVISKIKLEKSVGKIKEDGSIDYKDRESIKEVFQGDLIGEYYEGSQGHEGFNVYGSKIPIETVVMGPEMGANLFIDPDNPGVVKTSINGLLNQKENKLEVVETLVIDSDIDYETGNIEFSGNIEIKGKVATGFSVITFGNLVIHGIVEGANLFSSLDMDLRSGVVSQGSNKIECRGNMKARYLQNAKVIVGKNLEVEDFIYHSLIRCNGEVKSVEKSGLVVGGSISAKKKIEINVAGNRNGEPTELIAGIDQEMDDKIKNRKKDLALLEERKSYITEQLKKNFHPNFIRNPAAYASKLNKDQRELALKLVNQIKKIEDWITKAQKEYDRLVKLGPQYNFIPQIIIHKVKHSGVKDKVYNAPGAPKQTGG